MKELKVKNF